MRTDQVVTKTLPQQEEVKQVPKPMLKTRAAKSGNGPSRSFKNIFKEWA